MILSAANATPLRDADNILNRTTNNILPRLSFDRGDVVRVGICIPLEVDSIKVASDYPVLFNNKIQPTWVHNLQSLDSDDTGKVMFHDKNNG